MKVRSLFAAAALIALMAPAQAGAPPKPVDSVHLARTWEAAVEEAKALNVPLVVHSHGFYCGPCWGMHSAVMCNKKYMEFADDNTVEVITLDRLDEGIEKKDKRAETYDAKVGGETVKYMVEFPGLTSAEMLALHSSKAASYNKTGKIPYTCLVDPYTEEELKNWSGSTPAGDIMDAVTEAKKALQKDHGKGLARKDIKVLDGAQTDADAKLAKNDYAGALDALGKIASKAEKWPDGLKTRLEAAKTKIVDAAKAALDKIEEAKATDPAQAKKDLTALASRLKGTGLEGKAKDLLATM